MFDCLRRGIFSCGAFLFLMATLPSVRGADAESRAFDVAQKFLADGFPEFAENEFARFVTKYPSSPRLARALLLESQAMLAQKKFLAAVALLTTNLPNAAGLADQFQLGIAKAQAQSGHFDAAADSYGMLVAKYTNSPLRLEATLGEAEARFNRRQWARVVSLLQNQNGVFAAAAASSPDTESVTRGRLLLAEALLEQKNFAAAEAVVGAIPDAALNSQSRWQREYLRARAQFAAQKLPAALAATSNLVSIATASRQPALEAAGVALQAEILEALGQPAAAILAYQQNQRAGWPQERVREAVFRTVELTIAQGQLTNALARIQTFLSEHTNEVGSDIALLTLAELRLKQFQSAQLDTNAGAVINSALADTNVFPEIVADCDKLLHDFTNSPFAGQAQLVRGWALLAQAKPAESLGAFRAAAETLPWSEAQAVARLKTADLEFQTRDITNALRNYRRVLADYTSLERVQSQLVPRARYQILQASMAAGDLTSANKAMEVLLRDYPANSFTERTLLLFGQVVNELGRPAEARMVFSNFVAHWPDSPLRPKVELAIARTYEREQNWPGAIAQYDSWVLTFPTNENLPRAEFYRAEANFHAGRDTNAFLLFTNFVARFPTNEFAPRAQYWVGDYYAGTEQFVPAEASYQIIYQNTNWPVTSLSYEARLKAGRAALMRGSFNDAVPYFTSLIDDKNCPKDVVVQAAFAYGDAWRRQQPSTNALEKFRTALVIYEQIPTYHPEDPLVPRAWGEIGACYFQLASANPEDYVRALEYFAKVTNEPAADLAARQQAEVGIGHVKRKQAKLAEEKGDLAKAASLLEEALRSYLNVVYADYNGEVPDAFWLKEAALNAAEIAEMQRKWNSAHMLYQRLIEMFPTLRDGLKNKILRAEEQAALQKE